MSVTSEKVRALFSAGDKVRDAGLRTPEDIERYDDICYGHDETWQVLDVYRPKSYMGKKLPVIVNVHGGAWVYGTKESYQYYGMFLAQHGFAVVNFTYRLAPEFKFPAPLEDTNSVFHWVLEHAEDYGFDTEHLFAAGDSAGANLLNLYTILCTNASYAAKFSLEAPVDFKPKALLLNCGQYEINVNTYPEDLTTALMKDYLPNAGSEEDLLWINALPYLKETYPPAFIMTAVKDFLKEASMPLVKKLEEYNIPYQYKVYGDEMHPLEHVFHCDIRSEEAKKCNMEELEFLRSFCDSL